MLHPMSLSAAYSAYRTEQLSQAGDGTDRKYLAAIKKLRTMLDREPLLSDLTDKNLRDLFIILQGEGMRANSVNAIRAKIISLWTWCAKTRRVSVWPTVKPLVEQERLPSAWTPDELRRLWDSCGNAPGNVDGIPSGDWWLALHSLMYDTGERRGAVMALRWTDTDLDAGWANFRAETRKGKRKPLLKDIHPSTVELLRSLKDHGFPEVFHWPYSEVTLYNRYTQILKVAGLPHERGDKFHKIRKTHASLLEAAGGDATKSLGHGDRRMTHQNYLDPRLCGGVRATDLLFRPAV